MVESGCTAKQIAATVNAYLAVEHEKLLGRRACGRLRQRRYIDRLRNKNDASLTVITEKHEQNQQPYDASLTVTTKEHIYVEEMDVKSMYVKEMEVKEEATNVEIKKEMVKHSSIKDTELSRTRTRARKKSGTEIPE